MSTLETARDALRALTTIGTPGLGQATELLDQMVRRQVDPSGLQGVMDQLPLHVRLGLLHRGKPGAVERILEAVAQLEAELVDERERQARNSFDRFGDALGFANLAVYLRGTDDMEGIMEIPDWPEDHRAHFVESVLVDGRILDHEQRGVGLSEVCRLAELHFGGNDGTFERHDASVAQSGLRWMIFQDGRRNHNRKPSDCRASFAECEVGVDTMEGIARYVQGELVLWKHFMDCTNSVYASRRGHCACLGVSGHGPGLYCSWADSALPLFGAASRGK